MTLRRVVLVGAFAMVLLPVGAGGAAAEVESKVIGYSAQN